MEREQVGDSWGRDSPPVFSFPFFHLSWATGPSNGGRCHRVGGFVSACRLLATHTSQRASCNVVGMIDETMGAASR